MKFFPSLAILGIISPALSVRLQPEHFTIRSGFRSPVICGWSVISFHPCTNPKLLGQLWKPTFPGKNGFRIILPYLIQLISCLDECMTLMYSHIQ